MQRSAVELTDLGEDSEFLTPSIESGRTPRLWGNTGQAVIRSTGRDQVREFNRWGCGRRSCCRRFSDTDREDEQTEIL